MNVSFIRKIIQFSPLRQYPHFVTYLGGTYYWLFRNNIMKKGFNIFLFWIHALILPPDYPAPMEPHICTSSMETRNNN